MNKISKNLLGGSFCILLSSEMKQTFQRVLELREI